MDISASFDLKFVQYIVSVPLFVTFLYSYDKNYISLKWHIALYTKEFCLLIL